MHDHIKSKTRATVLSGISLIRSLLFSLTNPIIGFILDKQLILGSIGLMTVILVLSGVTLVRIIAYNAEFMR